MKSLFTLLTGAALFLSVQLTAMAGNVLTVAVFDFESKDAAVRELGPKVATMVNAALSAEADLVLVERAEIQKVLGEQELGLSGTVTTDSAARVGNLTGAKILVTGRVFKMDQDTVIVAKIIGTETSRVFGTTVQGGGSVADLSAQLAKQIGALLTKRGDDLLAKVVTRDERIAQIVKSLKEGSRPAVSVHLVERHFGGPVIDPAAETELGLVLQKAGFTLVDEKSDKKADIEITGEAFSTYGMRKGNLISCRSRIELKARQREGGKILTVESQTSVAVDIAEQTAAKTALENAAVEVAGRLLPKLLK